MKTFRWYTSKTVWGTILAAAAHIAMDVRNPTTWAEGVGAVIAAVGARDAIAKNGAGK